jgi:hypothetical protein
MLAIPTNASPVFVQVITSAFFSAVVIEIVKLPWLV